MATVYETQPPTTTPEVGGMGHARKRVEDARFIRGAGEYIEDFNLPGQLWLDIVRSPYAHARIKSIDASEALKVPGVAAVVTGKDLEGYGLAWMPTLAGDKQAVLAVEEVLFQSQEVAAVVATSRYAAADGVAAVLVDYEPLEVASIPTSRCCPALRSCARTVARTTRTTTSGITSRVTNRPPTPRWRTPRSSSRSTSTCRASMSRASRRAAWSRTGTPSTAT